LESEERSMEALDAVVEIVDEKHFIAITLGAGSVAKIPLSDDKANDVKAAFNKIIARVKLGVFQIKLSTVGEDLYSQVANEYLVQLNREIKEVRGEMEAQGLTEN
jgi:hypothetical protein